MMSKRILIGVGSLLLVLIAVSFLWLSTRTRGQASTAVIQNVPYDVRVETSPKASTVGVETKIRIHVSQNGKPVDVNETGRLLHVMIVSANLRDTYHTLSPTPEGNGVYSVEHVFTQPGQYRIWTELDDTAAPQRHDQNAEQIAYAELTVNGTTSTTSSLIESNEASIGSYRVKLLTPQVQAGKPATLRIEVRDKTGKLVELYAHEPFLYFMSGENFSFFRHGHGVTLPDGSAGLENTFPKAGKYVWWLQLQFADGEGVPEMRVPFLITAT